MERFEIFHLEQVSSNTVEATVKLKLPHHDSEAQSNISLEYEVQEIKNVCNENIITEITTSTGHIRPNVIDTVPLPYSFKPGFMYRIVLTKKLEKSSVRPARVISTEKTFRKCKYRPGFSDRIGKYLYSTNHFIGHDNDITVMRNVINLCIYRYR